MQLHPSMCFSAGVNSYSTSVFGLETETQGNIITSASLDLMDHPFHSLRSADVTKQTAMWEMTSLILRGKHHVT